MPILPVHCRCSGGGEPGPVPKQRHATTVDLCSWCPGKGEGCECAAVHRVVVRDQAGRVVSQTDYEGDGVTPFELGAGCVIGPCSECPCGHEEPRPKPGPEPFRTWVDLCDWDGINCEDESGESGWGCDPFRRLLEIDPATKSVTATDYTVGGEERYEVQGLVVDCDRCPDCTERITDCDPVPMCPGLDALGEGESWTLPPRTESVSVHVVCGPVFVRSCCGASTREQNREHEVIQIDEAGASMTWSAPTVGCTPGELCGEFSVWTGECAAAYVQYLTTDCEGACAEESGEESE